MLIKCDNDNLFNVKITGVIQADCADCRPVSVNAGVKPPAPRLQSLRDSVERGCQLGTLL